MWPFCAVFQGDTMERRERIRKSSHFRFVYNHGKSLVDENVVIYITKNGKTFNRIGISVSKKVGKSVVRNRVRRVIRESYRVNKNMFKRGYDIVIVARVRAAKANYKEISSSIIKLLGKGGLVVQEGE